jgi:hypothetical protein
VDEDCDGEVDEDALGALTWYTDADGDGWGGEAYVACERGDGALVGGDCDDGAADVNPDAHETCDDRDEDCDGAIDEDASGALTWYADADGDGWGDTPVVACEQGELALDAGDCDDGDADRFPGAPEWCDGEDDDCDGVVDEDAVDAPTWYVDADGDGVGAAPYVACEAGDAVATGGDCDDADPGAFPGGVESCDGRDDDCDGETDEEGGATWFVDGDGDGFGAEAFVACEPGSGIAVAGDCDDSDATVLPGGTERCNGRDDDCDGTSDEDAVDAPTWYVDADGDGVGSSPYRACEEIGRAHV